MHKMLLAFIEEPWPGLAFNVMAARALGQRKRHRAMTHPAFFSPQYHRHVDFGFPGDAFEHFIVTASAVEPCRMWAVRKFDHCHFAGIFENDLRITRRHFSTHEYVCSGFDKALIKRLDPAYLIADGVRRQHR